MQLVHEMRLSRRLKTQKSAPQTNHNYRKTQLNLITLCAYVMYRAAANIHRQQHNKYPFHVQRIINHLLHDCVYCIHSVRIRCIVKMQSTTNSMLDNQRENWGIMFCAKMGIEENRVLRTIQMRMCEKNQQRTLIFTLNSI